MAKQIRGTRGQAISALSREVETRLKAGWQDRSSTTFTKWNEGLVIEGELLRWKKSQFEGEVLIVVATAEGTQTLPCPAILRDRLEGVKAGTEVYIVCRGKVALENGQEAWDFTVLTKGPKPQRAAETDGDIPF